MNGDHAPDWPVYSEQAPKMEITHLVDKAMQIQINGYPDMRVVFEQGAVAYWVDYDYPLGAASSLNRVEVLGTKRINNEECYEIMYVSAESGGNVNPTSYWCYVRRMDGIHWVRFTHERDGQTIMEEIDDTFPTPTTIEPGMSWRGHDTQRDAATGEVYTSRIKSAKVEAVVELRMGTCVYNCLKVVMISTNADGVGAPTLVEKYIDGSGLTVLRRKYMGEDNIGGREQLRQSPFIKRNDMRYYLWYDGVTLSLEGNK